MQNYCQLHSLKQTNVKKRVLDLLRVRKSDALLFLFIGLRWCGKQKQQKFFGNHIENHHIQALESNGGWLLYFSEHYSFMSKMFADKVIDFNRHLHFSGKLPEDFQVMNPYLDNPETMTVMQAFYHKYYNDRNPRRFIIGINPSRHGAGVTGVPFTDTKRLESVCGISMQSAYTHEVSSVFVYDMIDAFGGAASFYKEFYINSPFPLAIIRRTKDGKWLNANYYDDPALFEMVKDFMVSSLKKHISLGLDTSEVFVLGKKNADFIGKLNTREKLFGKLTVLEHPRYIQQYKLKDRQLYIDRYLLAFGKTSHIK